MTILFGCKQARTTIKGDYTEAELYRPNFHFTPEKGWMNDPNGMFYYNGYYHLFFQYYPDGNVWGPMHWGHAISTDMISWTEKPIAIYPDEKGYIFSGSAVVDINNTSGFGTLKNPPIIAMFTYHNMEKEKAGDIKTQSQAIAYSLDEGMTWTKYEANPVIENPNIKDFRDPKMTWDAIHKQWLMVLAAGDKTMFYTSQNLKEWTLQSDFGSDVGAHGGVWECPDFFPLAIEGSDEYKWVLLLSINPGGPNGGSATQYFVGDFDGKKFKLDPSFTEDIKGDKGVWIDYGRDNYAGVTFSNVSEVDGRKLFLGWMSNWNYAQKVPTETWRSSMTVARELVLIKDKEHYSVSSRPVKELQNYVGKTIKKEALKIDKETIIIDKSLLNLASMDVRFTLKNLKDDTYTFSLSNDANNTIQFGINKKDKYFFVDRTKSGNLAFSDLFANAISKAPITEDFNAIDVRVIVDKTSIEIFYNNGKTVMTETFFPEKQMETFSVSKAKTEFIIEQLIINQLNFN
ncbi:glycoside hydrolase family 32 protein [Flavobacterium algicola]|uniref:glycoside hydrolase family 32 protein n=1 Tax=Flavobacterium algicola TaxID=556529 RepID=UPI001EFCAC36|nr:glycoside hydrolase family 32 protein [Flavobacterium algicola]MCG9791364.1 glycoside hydrolase family 32 protein [Flavobacterium algicola]